MAKRDREAVNQGLDQMFGSSSSADRLSNVMHSDRKRTGRTPASPPPEVAPEPEPPSSTPEAPAESMTSHNVIPSYDNMTSLSYDNKASPMTIGQTDTHSDKRSE